MLPLFLWSILEGSELRVGKNVPIFCSICLNTLLHGVGLFCKLGHFKSEVSQLSFNFGYFFAFKRMSLKLLLLYVLLAYLTLHHSLHFSKIINFTFGSVYEY